MAHGGGVGRVVGRGVNFSITRTPPTPLVPVNVFSQEEEDDEQQVEIVNRYGSVFDEDSKKQIYRKKLLGTNPRVHSLLLLRSVYDGDVSFFKKLVSEIEDRKDLAKTIADIKDKEGLSVIHLCVLQGEIEMCKYLIGDLKHDVDLKEAQQGNTPLLFALMEDHFRIASYLLENGANPHLANNGGYTALHLAANKGHRKLLQSLLSKDVDVDALSTHGTPLQRAGIKGHHKAVKLLLDHHANPNISNRHIGTPILASITARSLRCVKLLLEAGADPNARGLGRSPLETAASVGQTDMVLLLLKSGADPNATCMHGMKAIELAAIDHKNDIVEILFPVTSPISSYLDWSITGIMNQVHSEETRIQRELILKEKCEKAKFEGDAAFREEDYMMATYFYSVGIVAEPKNALLLSNRSLCWLRLGEGEDALVDAMACIDLKPDWSKAYYRAGLAWSKLRNFKKAGEMFLKCSKLDPNNAEVQKACRENATNMSKADGTGFLEDMI